MPRDLTLANGRLLVNFDHSYQLRDFYYPNIGKENQSTGHPFRFGVWTENQFSWASRDEWERDLRYRPETLVTQVTLTNRRLGLRLICADAVDFHEDLYLRQVRVENLTDREREVRLFFHHDFHISESAVGDTAYYRPWERLLIHYKDQRYFAIGAGTDRGWGIDQYATGRKEVNGQEGTWRDAEDGRLEGNPIAQGSVDSTIGVHVQAPAGGAVEAFYWIAVGASYRDVQNLNKMVNERTPAEFLRRTANYWRLWVNKEQSSFGPLPEKIVSLYKQSLLILRTHVDNGGGIIAATDSDIEQFGRDTYCYVWPRDGALVAHALDRAGFGEPSARFFDFARQVITKEGYFLHKYNPDGSLGSSWQPWVLPEPEDLPVQEDETALVLWALWEHFDRSRDVETIKPLYRPLIYRAANWMSDYRQAETGLPRPSHDLWEERFGVHAWTVGAIYGGLRAAANFARAFGETENAARYEANAQSLREATDKHFWQESWGRFARTLYRKPGGALEADPVIDASMCGLYRFGMYGPREARLQATMQAVHERLWAKTDVGGLARYEGDSYHRVSGNDGRVAGNPWFVGTAWLAEWYTAAAQTAEDLDPARKLLEWIAEHALPSGVLAEQVDPYTDAPLSVAPLTWSHAQFVIAVQAYLDRQGELGGGVRTAE